MPTTKRLITPDPETNAFGRRQLSAKLQMPRILANALLLSFLLVVYPRTGTGTETETETGASRTATRHREDEREHWVVHPWSRRVRREEEEEEEKGVSREGEESLRSRGASLAFVFDSTGSMQDELNQVKAGASKILAALRDHPDAPIYNYIWVPFSDPEIGPVTVTRDDRVFQERVQEVVVFGGGDCPEMSIGAIKKALEASLPNSYVYVFTDASAKDHRLANEVVSLVQRKQSQVVFILTGDCMDQEEPNYKAYERIAESSSGQIYRLSRSEVKEVLEYVNVAIQPHVVSLLSVNKPAPDRTNPDKVEVVIDESLKQFTVSVSGVNASINVTDPKGMNVEGPPKLYNVLNLSNIKVVNVKEPEPGSWSVLINSDSNYTVRSTGLSKVKFRHGFSTAETGNLKETNYRPLKGAKSWILIQTSDAEKVFNVTSVDLVSLSGEVLEEVVVRAVPGMEGVYRGGRFVPPEELFYLGVRGFGEDGLPVRRITSTAVSAQLPEKPIVTMRSIGVGRVDGAGLLKCEVESVVPFSVRWYKDGKWIGEEKNCSETCEVVLRMEKLSLGSEGTYSCSARSVAGLDSKSVVLRVIGEAPSVSVQSPVVVSSGETAYLRCVVESKIPYVVKWTQFTARSHNSGVLHAVSTGVKLENETLMIESARAEDEGWYVCKAVNKGGESEGRVLLVVKEPLVVTVEPSSMRYTEGESVRLRCSATGKPEPRLEWMRDQRPIQDEEPSVHVEEVMDGKVDLVIDYLERKNAGVYTCNAVNDEGSAAATAELVYTEKPRVKAKENSVMVKAGSEVVLSCRGSGEPRPDIRWYKGEAEVEERAGLEVQSGTLTLHSAHSSDGGEYSCVGENVLGSDVDYIGLIVGTPPSFLQKPTGEKKIEIGQNGTMACSAIGVPPPEVKWRRFDDSPLDSSRMLVLSSGGLRITRTKVEDGGRYVCTAENVFGSASREVLMKVTGIEKPVADKAVEVRKVESSSGSELIIPCGIMLGKPRGEVKWYKDGEEVVEEEEERMVEEESGRLVIRKAKGEDRGRYLCRVENSAGKWSRVFDVVIRESPRIKEMSESGLKGKVGGEVVIPCPVEGYPVPRVTWRRNGLPLPRSSSIFQDEVGSLIIRNLTEEGSGVYVCTATNVLGSASKATSISVQVPPVFPVDVQDSPVNVVEGHVVVLNCNVTAVPEARIRWFKNDEPLLQDADQPKILRFVANMDDTGVFKCVADNEAGSTSKEFNVSILVPPKILAKDTEDSIRAKAGVPITLHCDVFGVPEPTILWQRNGMYLTQNTTEVAISPSGSLTIHNVRKESAGAYTCDAENLGGIAQRIYYLQVNYPPRIVEEDEGSRVRTLKEGEDYSLGCVVEGSPKPEVVWKKNGLPILGQQHDLVVLEDNTLVFLEVSKETSGVYKCEAVSSEGAALVEYEVRVVTPPSLMSEFYPTRLDVNEGESLALTCPCEQPSHIQWFKDGEPLTFLQERSDEAQMKLSADQSTLTIIEAHPSDGGNYSCVATNPGGRSDARFLVDVLMTPHFEEFSHVAHRTILTGGEVVLNCSVSGNPRPKVTWRKESTAVTPYGTPGVHVTQDSQHLVIANGKVHHTGTYVCVAANKVSTKEREFYVTVVEPPQIAGPLKETVEVMEGDDVTLRCEGDGAPAPTFSWTKEDAGRKLFASGNNYLSIANATCDDGGTYTCHVTNMAGTRIKYFQVNVFQKPRNDHRLSAAAVKCTPTPGPTEEITSGHILSNTTSVEPPTA